MPVASSLAPVVKSVYARTDVPTPLPAGPQTITTNRSGSAPVVPQAEGPNSSLVRPVARPSSAAPRRLLPDFRRSVIMASGAGPGPSLSTATDLGVPIGFGALAALFLLVQAALGRRDPRLADAPASGDDDSVSFE